MKKRAMMLSIVAGVGIWQTQAAVVNFTAGEGYENGDLTNHVDWVGRTGDSGFIVTNDIPGYTGTGGVYLDNTANFVEAIFQEPLEMDSKGDEAIVKIRFRYTSTAFTANNKGVASVNWCTTPTAGDIAAVSVRRMSDGNLRLWVQGNIYSSTVSEQLVGITNSTDTSQWLEFTGKLAKNSDTGTTDWFISATLVNLETGVKVAEASTAAFTPAAGFNSASAVYGAIGNRYDNVDVGATNRLVDRFETIFRTPATVIGGATGNGDFELTTPPGLTGAQWYSATPNWFHATGSEGLNFSTDVTTGGGSQPNSRQSFHVSGRVCMNNSGYAIQSEGQTFDISLTFGRVVGTYGGDEYLRAFLFTTTNAVDGNLVTTDMETVAEVIFNSPQTDPTWSIFSSNGFYTTTASDLGKTFYLAFQYMDPVVQVATFPRIDFVQLGVVTPPPVLTLWDTYASEHGLTNGPAGDQDMDGQDNWYEYVLGGDPTNPAVLGIHPTISGSGGFVFSIRGDDTLSYSVLTNMDLVFGSWGTNGPIPVTENDGAMHETIENVGTSAAKLFIKLLAE